MKKTKRKIIAKSSEGGFEKYMGALHKVMVSEIEPLFKEHQKELGQAVMNRLLGIAGPTVVESKKSPKELFVGKMFWGFSEIFWSYERLLDLEVYINRFPYKGTRISRDRHLGFIIEAYLLIYA